MARAIRASELDATEYQWLALTASTVGHLFIFALVLLQFGSGWGDFQQPIVYSITIERGKRLGGISQVPDEKNKTMIAPPKNTTTKEKKAEKQEIPQEIKKEEKPKIPEADKGEVQIKKKEAAKEEKKSKDEKTKKDEKPKTEEKYEDVMQRYLGESSAAGGSSFGAAALGGKGMGGGTLISPEHLAYLNKIKEYVREGFFWNDRNSPLKCEITFTIGTDGRIADPVISASSGNRSYDDAALRAVLKANPLPPPLASFYGKLNPVTINLTPADS